RGIDSTDRGSLNGGGLIRSADGCGIPARGMIVETDCRIPRLACPIVVTHSGTVGGTAGGAVCAAGQRGGPRAIAAAVAAAVIEPAFVGGDVRREAQQQRGVQGQRPGRAAAPHPALRATLFSPRAG